MKATKYFLILLALVALFTFACKPEAETEKKVETEEVVVNPIDKWMADVKALVEPWEAKAKEGNLTQADWDEFIAAKQPLMDAANKLDQTALTEEQKPIMEDLMARMDKLNSETIPAAVK